MGIRTVTVAICDLCGKTTPAKAAGSQYNETIYEKPDDWHYAKDNHQAVFCPECWNKAHGNTGDYWKDR